MKTAPLNSSVQQSREGRYIHAARLLASLRPVDESGRPVSDGEWAARIRLSVKRMSAFLSGTDSRLRIASMVEWIATEYGTRMADDWMRRRSGLRPLLREAD